jgi:hypothetical protein
MTSEEATKPRCSTRAFQCTSWPPVAGTILRLLLRSYAKRTTKADSGAAAAIGALSKSILMG